MKITALKTQVRDKSRVNVFVDGKYRFSLDITQVADLKLSTGKEYTEEELAALEDESQFGKLYTRTLEYVLTRPRSQRELGDYLYKKTRPTPMKTGGMKPGVSTALTERVRNRLLEKGYVDDTKFARFWVDNRNQRKGTSIRKLRSELSAKGVAPAIIDEALSTSDRSDDEEILKIIHKKARRYDDDQKMIAYLARQGFSFDAIRSGLAAYHEAAED